MSTRCHLLRRRFDCSLRNRATDLQTGSHASNRMWIFRDRVAPGAATSDTGASRCRCRDPGITATIGPDCRAGRDAAAGQGTAIQSASGTARRSDHPLGRTAGTSPQSSSAVRGTGRDTAATRYGACRTDGCERNTSFGAAVAAAVSSIRDAAGQRDSAGHCRAFGTPDTGTPLTGRAGAGTADNGGDATDTSATGTGSGHG